MLLRHAGKKNEVKFKNDDDDYYDICLNKCISKLRVKECFS
jgi:hypothetical protein